MISKFVGPDRNTSEDKVENLIEIFEERGVPIFLHDFFQWTSEEIFVQKEIFESLHKAEFIIDDLFRTIYQEMVSPATRHALGEFYTPVPLARKMVEEVYEVGQFVLDPACGSGTFLIEILNIINNSTKKMVEKVEAVSKIYGFDINPIAVLVARANLLLLTDKIFTNQEKIPINIFLADSLNPINEFITVDKAKLYKKSLKRDRFKEVENITSLEKWGASAFGETERFNMPAINDSLIINVKFFKYNDYFGDLLRELDRFLSKDLEFDNILKKIYNSIEDNWLEAFCEGHSDKKLRDNFEYIAEKLYNFVKNDKNHIWAYLLFNAIGVRKMKETINGIDLIIGNPPWMTISSIQSLDYKENLKIQSRNLGLYMGGKHTPNTELCSIFFYKCTNLYLKRNGKIFFVTTAAIETGDQHSKFRMFSWFKDIYLWKFLINDVFRIHNVCIGAKFGNQPIIDRLNIKTKIFQVNSKNKDWEFELKEEKIFVPYNLKSIIRDKEAKRLIPLENLDDLLPTKESIYKTRFKRGADLFPRNFFFITITVENTIVPNKNLIQHVPWTFYPVEEYDIEENYIYNVCKSTELVPFHLLSTVKCFLPIEQEDHIFHDDLIKHRARQQFEVFREIYRNIQERDGRQITDLWENLNHRNKLANPMQFSRIKVIFNNTGSRVKSAILKHEVIVDESLYYLGLKNINEANYICSVLNSNCISEQIKKTGATGASGSIRAIAKRALDFPIPEYDENNTLHNQIVELGRECEDIIDGIIKDLKKKKLNSLKKKIKCKNCGSMYSKSTFARFRENHQNFCEKVVSNYNWTDNDWVDLKDINLEEVELSRMKVQNMILRNADIKEKLEELDKIIIELLTSEGEEN